MKRSQTVALTILASVCLMATGCDKDQKTQRDMYADREKCEQDWGSSECEPDNTAPGASYRGPHYYYLGGRPWYYPRSGSDPREVPPTHTLTRTPAGHPSPNAVSSVSSRVSRGGFGSSGHFHGSGS